MVFVLLLGLLVLNGLLAMSEIAVVSARRGRLEQDLRRGRPGARQALELAGHPTRFLSTVQIGITLVGISAGAFGEAELVGPLARILEASPWLAPHAHWLATALVLIGITYLSLVLGELVPKRLGMGRPEPIARLVAGPMHVLSRLAAPFVWLLTRSTDAVLRLFGGATRPAQEVSDDDIRSLVRRGAELGVLHEKERELVERVLRFGDRQVRELMVPRGEIVHLEPEWTMDRIRAVVSGTPHTHFPLCRGGLDQVVGMVHVKDLLRSGFSGQDFALTDLATPPLYVLETTAALRVLERFANEHTHVAIVVDEFGGTEGLVTLNDFLCVVLGQIDLPRDDEEPRAVQRADGSWLLDGRMTVSELKELLAVEELPREAELRYTTVAGLLLANLETMPKRGYAFAWERFRLEVVDMDGHRIDQVLLTFPDEAPARRA